MKSLDLLDVGGGSSTEGLVRDVLLGPWELGLQDVDVHSSSWRCPGEAEERCVMNWRRNSQFSVRHAGVLER